MAEITKVYTERVPALRFIGKKYGDENRVNGGYGKQWGEWFTNGWFDVLENHIKSPNETCADGGAYLGYMRHKDGEPFQYWIGMFAPAETEVPEGFAHIDVPAGTLGVAWLYGKESELYHKETKCYEKLTVAGHKVITHYNGAHWFFERYVCPRFTTPDENGNVTIDICFYIEE